MHSRCRLLSRWSRLRVLLAPPLFVFVARFTIHPTQCTIDADQNSILNGLFSNGTSTNLGDVTNRFPRIVADGLSKVTAHSLANADLLAGEKAKDVIE